MVRSCEILLRPLKFAQKVCRSDLIRLKMAIGYNVLDRPRRCRNFKAVCSILFSYPNRCISILRRALSTKSFTSLLNVALTWGKCWREVKRSPGENPRRIRWLSVACRSSLGVGGCTCLKNFTRRSKTARTRRRSSLSLGVTKSLSSCHWNMSKASNSRMLSKSSCSWHFQRKSRVGMAGWQRFHRMEWMKYMAACEANRAESFKGAPGQEISPWTSKLIHGHLQQISQNANPCKLALTPANGCKWKFLLDRPLDLANRMLGSSYTAPGKSPWPTLLLFNEPAPGMEMFPVAELAPAQIETWRKNVLPKANLNRWMWTPTTIGTSLTKVDHPCPSLTWDLSCTFHELPGCKGHGIEKDAQGRRKWKCPQASPVSFHCGQNVGTARKLYVCLSVCLPVCLYICMCKYVHVRSSKKCMRGMCI